MPGKCYRILIFSLLAICLFATCLQAAPSVLEYEGSSVIWSINGLRVWRFPAAHAAEVTAMSERFNNLYKKGFKLTDLHVAKRNDKWSLCIKDSVLFSARPEHGGVIKLNTHMMSLQWMSKIYEAVGGMHAHDLTPKYRLRGGYDISTSVSWYGGKFIGRKFANGERFTESHLTAAAKNLPFGTLVKITTPATGKSVVVRITDRFAEHKNRALDISHAAAEILGIKRMGVAKAQVQVIGKVDRIGGK